MRYDDRNAVTERVSSIVLQDYLIWTPAQVLEHLRKVLGAHRVGHSVFTMSKIFNNNFLGGDSLYLTSLNRHNPARLHQQEI